MGILLWAVPLCAIALLALLRRGRALHTVSIAAAAAMTVPAAVITAQVMRAGTFGHAFLGGLFYVDAVSVLMLDIVVIISLLVSIYSVGYLEQERTHGKIDEKRMRLFYILMYLFIFTMIVALTVRNMGVMWIAIEGTTLASAFLVGFNNDKQALEGAWKYVIICSVGISLALLGIIFLHISATDVLDEAGGLDWTALYGAAAKLDGPSLRFAFIFILVGFGTKAGLVPMHTWLPDAHSQAPSPISALLSGVLLNSAMYAIIRTVAIVNRNLGGSAFTGGLMIALGLLSILAAALFILTQKDYKRLLAYSSIEHMGILSLSVGLFTPASLFAAFFHMINHSLTKSLLFLSSGNILQKYGTRDIRKIKGLMRALPITGTAMLLGLFAIGGMPPFSVFASEFNVIASAFEAGRPFIGGAAALLLALAFAGIVYALFNIFHASAGLAGEAPVPPGETNIAGAAVLLVLLAAITVTGIVMPEGLRSLITNAQKIISGGGA